jgi:outer membrane immunogenic protein
MHKLLVAAAAAPALLTTAIAANAADLPARPAPAPAPVYVPAPFTWTGCYLGANIGGAWAHGNVTDTTLGINVSNGTNNGRFIGGGEGGCNYQMGSFVIGAEGDFDWAANNNGNGTSFVVPAAVPGIGGNTLNVVSNNNWVSTVAARFGFAADRVLFYGKAGGGWVGNNGFTVTNTTTGASISGGNSNTNSGWLVGAGIEWAFAYNWTAKIEYDYLGLSSRSFTVPATSPLLPGDTFTIGSNNVQMVKFGINYLFNWSNPVVARY